jgi:hypothetical protein
MAMTVKLPIAQYLIMLLLGSSLGISPGWTADDEPDDYPYRTVLTLARDGSWGTATDSDTGQAIAAAIRDCKAMSRSVNSCGARLTTIFRGWSLAVLCGDEIILVAASQRSEAERMAVAREAELRLVYRRDMPFCVRIATVGPDGAVVAPQREAAGRR